MTEPNIVIRRAEPEDAKAAVDLVFPILRSYGVEPEPERLDRNIITFGSNNPDVMFDFVAEVDGQFLGLISVADKGGPELKIESLFVSPLARRRGLGKKLIERAIDKARELGRERITLETREIFREAVSLYESTGWRRGADLPAGYGPDRTYYIDL